MSAIFSEILLGTKKNISTNSEHDQFISVSTNDSLTGQKTIFLRKQSYAWDQSYMFDITAYASFLLFISSAVNILSNNFMI